MKPKMDMLNGSIWNKIIQYALPVAATGILEQLFNASDLAIVGNFTGKAKTVAVAAVGANSPIIGLLLNFFIGIALGANVVIANAIGKGDEKTIHKAVHTSVITAVVCGLLVTLFGELFIGNLLQMLNVPEDVFPYALLYIRIYLLGMPVILRFFRTITYNPDFHAGLYINLAANNFLPHRPYIVRFTIFTLLLLLVPSTKALLKSLATAFSTAEISFSNPFANDASSFTEEFL